MRPAIPAWIVLRIAQPEVGAEVDAHAVPRHGADRSCALNSPWLIAANTTSDAPRASRDEKRNSVLPRKRRMDRRDRLAGESLRCHLHHLDLGVPREEPQQLASGVPRASDDGGADHELANA